MKRLYTYFMVILLLFIVGCTKPIVADTIPETITVYETVITTEIVEIENTQRIDELELELQQYKELISNLNELLSNVYYVECENADFLNKGTAFSIEYNKKYYIISAGHLVENEYGEFTDFKININNEWIYPELLYYENGKYNYNIDYAIFYSNKITTGLHVDTDGDNPKITLGHSGSIKEFLNIAQEGESGSPIVDIGGEVVGIKTNNIEFYTKIDIVLDKIK